MENARIELDLGKPDLSFMCPKCFAVNSINVEQHTLHLNTSAWISLNLKPCSDVLVYRNLIHAVHNCEENRADRQDMICIDPFLDTILPEFNRLGFATTYGRCSTNSHDALNPFIEFNISPSDKHAYDAKSQLCKAIIAAREDIFSRFDETYPIHAVAETMRCDFELMRIGQRLRITSEPVSVNPNLESCPLTRIPNAFTSSMNSVLHFLKKALNEPNKYEPMKEDD